MNKINDWFSISDNSSNIIIQYGATTSDKDMGEYLLYYKNLYPSEKKLTVVFDCRNIIYISIPNLYKKLVLMKLMQDTHKKYLEKFYVVLTSKYMRTLIDFAFSIVKPVVPYEIVDSF